MGKAQHMSTKTASGKGKITNLLHCSGHTAPLMTVKWETGEEQLTIAPEGVCVNQMIEVGAQEPNPGNTMTLRNVPDGTLVYNIESVPGDGGKFARSGGVFAKVLGRQGAFISVMLPSKKEKLFNENCRATVGIVAGSGRLEKPWVKAGKKVHAMLTRGKLFPRSAGVSMTPTDHPYGGRKKAAKNKAVSRHASPGRKVGSIAARRQGKRK